MVFSDLSFIYLFLPVFLGVYYLVPKKCKNIVLVVFSLFFYAWGEPFYIVLLLNLSFANYIFGYLICRFEYDRTLKLAFLVITLAVNLGVLISCKFSPDLIGLVNRWIPGLTIPMPKFALPLGLSFYTLSCISYIVDIYKGKCPRQRNIIHYLVYVTMFPRLLAGPVTLYRDLEPQITQRSVTIDSMSDGIGLFIKGLGKKVLLANNLNPLTSNILSTPAEQLPVLTAWLGAIAIIFQFYFDFSGYTDMARGLGRMLGFHLPRNFDSPLMARSVTDFWSRWNMTLVKWMQEYVYKPLGGGGKGPLITLANGFILCILVAFWHGLGVNYQLVAFYYFIILLLERLFISRWLKKIPGFIGMVYTFFITIFGFVILSHGDLGQIHVYFKALFGFANQPVYNDDTLYYLSTHLLVLVVCMLASNNFLKSRIEKTRKFYPRLIAVATPFVEVVVMIVSTAYLMNTPRISFLIFQF